MEVKNTLAVSDDFCCMNLTASPFGGYDLMIYIEANKQSSWLHFETKQEWLHFHDQIVAIGLHLPELRVNETLGH